MEKEQKIIYRYSSAFKQKVVEEVEKGNSINSIRKLYGIKGSPTISNWLKEYGKNHLLSKVVRIEMKDEKNIIRELEKRNRQLEKALADEKLKSMCLEALVEIAQEDYGIDLKKKSGKKE
jgi:transposase